MCLKSVNCSKIYDKCNKSIFRMMDELNCHLRAHFTMEEFGGRCFLKRCRCLSFKLNKDYNQANNKKSNLFRHLK